MVQPRKTRPCLTERSLMGRKESNQTKIIIIIIIKIIIIIIKRYQINRFSKFTSRTDTQKLANKVKTPVVGLYK